MLISFIDMLQYDFIVHAFIAGLAIAICASLLGPNLVLRHQSMISDGLSHVAFGAIIISIALGFAPLALAIPIVVIASYIILRISNSRTVHGDAIIAILSTSALAIGTIVNSLSTKTNIDLNSYLFGSILAVSNADLIAIMVTTIIIITVYVVFYRQIFAIAVDETFAKAIGIKTKYYNVALSALCSIVIILGMRMLGALLISSLIIFPCLSARQLTHSFKATIFVSVILSALSFCFGLTASYAFSLPSGASIVVANLFCLIACRIYRMLK